MSPNWPNLNFLVIFLQDELPDCQVQIKVKVYFPKSEKNNVFCRPKKIRLMSETALSISGGQQGHCQKWPASLSETLSGMALSIVKRVISLSI